MPESFVIRLSSEIIRSSHSKQRKITTSGLQAVMYILWAEHYRLISRPLFEECFQAWGIGPVIPSVYYEYCQFGGGEIYEPFLVHRQDTGEFSDLGACLNRILRLSDREARVLAKRKGGAWEKTYRGGVNKEHPIAFQDIIDLDAGSLDRFLLGFIAQPEKENPYGKINALLKKDSERIFSSSDVKESDIRELKALAESAKIILAKLDSEDLRAVQSFADMAVRICDSLL